MTDAPATPRRPWWVVALAALGIAALAFAIGRFSMFGAATAVTHPTTSSPEAGFARDMQVHHAQAVEMAMEIYRKTPDDELRALSYDIATAQAGQRGEMFGWLVQWNLPQSGSPTMAWMATSSAGHDHGVGDEPMTAEEIREVMGMASDAELEALSTATGQEADCLFLDLMIRHHEGAIPMAEAIVELGSEPRVLAVAEQMAGNPRAEIDAMTSMQRRLGCG